MSKSPEEALRELEQATETVRRYVEAKREYDKLQKFLAAMGAAAVVGLVASENAQGAKKERKTESAASQLLDKAIEFIRKQNRFVTYSELQQPMLEATKQIAPERFKKDGDKLLRDVLYKDRNHPNSQLGHLERKLSSKRSTYLYGLPEWMRGDEPDKRYLNE